MDHLQKVGLKLLAFGIAGLAFSIAFPLLAQVSQRGYLMALGGAFIAPYAVIAGGFMIRHGDASEGILGPLGTDERRRKVRVYFLICTVPALAVCALAYLILSQHGYHLLEP